ncbi:MAG: hypothetical protein CMP81_21565 [Fulvimarina sp.]|nr:hypothetical protein [Fulvimarina sp.]
MTPDPTDARHARLRAIENQIEQAREAVAMAQGSMTDPIVADEVEVLQAERQRLLEKIRAADDFDCR